MPFQIAKRPSLSNNLFCKLVKKSQAFIPFPEIALGIDVPLGSNVECETQFQLGFSPRFDDFALGLCERKEGLQLKGGQLVW